MCESAVLLNDRELSRQTSGACIYERVCRLNENILSKFSDNVNNRLNACGALICNDYCNFYEIYVIFNQAFYKAM